MQKNNWAESIEIKGAAVKAGQDLIFSEVGLSSLLIHVRFITDG